MPAPAPVKIIGAGIGGLSLGQTLRARGVPVEIFDRGSGHSRHAYSITLQTSVAKPLARVLGLDVPQLQQQVAIGIDQQQHANGSSTNCFRANRARFENLLRRELTIHNEHKLTKASPSPNGLQLAFDNGEQIESSLTVAADGALSQMRNSLFSDHKLDILPFVVINGKRWLSKEDTNRLGPIFEGKDKLELRREDVLLQAYVNDIVDGSISVSYTYSRPARGDDDPLFKPNRPLSGAADIPEEYYEELAKLELNDDGFQTLFAGAEVRSGRNLSWLMRSGLVEQDALKSLAAENIYMIGEAAHTLPILRSYGANVSISDALDLGDHIAHGFGPELFYDKKYEGWKRDVEVGEKQLRDMHIAHPRPAL